MNVASGVPLRRRTTMQRAVPFNKPFIAGKELAYVAEAVTLGNISGDGHFTQRCSQLLEEQFGIKRVLLTPSCTAALEMAVLLAGVGPGDEVTIEVIREEEIPRSPMPVGADGVILCRFSQNGRADAPR